MGHSIKGATSNSGLKRHTQFLAVRPAWQKLYVSRFSDLSSQDSRDYGYPTDAIHYLGFRVAELPEPSTITLFVLGAVGVLVCQPTA